MTEDDTFARLKYEVFTDKAGTRKYFNSNGELHREDGPAVEWANGHKYWFRHDKLHRDVGPAIEYANGNRYWYLNGIRLTENKYVWMKKRHSIT